MIVLTSLNVAFIDVINAIVAIVVTSDYPTVKPAVPVVLIFRERRALDKMVIVAVIIIVLLAFPTTVTVVVEAMAVPAAVLIVRNVFVARKRLTLGELSAVLNVRVRRQ